MKNNKLRINISLRLVLCLAILFLCFALLAQKANAQRATTPVEKNRGSSELNKLFQEKENLKNERLKLFQEESTSHVQQFKPLDRIRKQLDTEENDLYAECSDGKTAKGPQYNYCTPELTRFNENVRFYNDRLNDLQARLAIQKQQFREKSEELDRKERELDRKIGSQRYKR
ncbi:MAG: hypothetical protein ACYDHW_13525 [Syntrophorhabdaceae bacterium]